MLTNKNIQSLITFLGFYKEDCIHRRFPQVDLLITVIMMFRTALVPFWNIFCFLRLSFQTVCVLVMKLLVIRNISRTLNIFTRKNKRCCFFPHAIYLTFTFQRSPKNVNKMIYYPYMTSGKRNRKLQYSKMEKKTFLQ